VSGITQTEWALEPGRTDRRQSHVAAHGNSKPEGNTIMSKTELRELTTEELDAASAGRIIASFSLFGIRFTWGETEDGTIMCVRGPSGGSCIYDAS
jgi:hypothetical protein